MTIPKICTNDLLVWLSFSCIASNFDNLDIKVSFDISSFGIHRIFPLVNYMNLFIGSGAISPISFIFSPCFYLFFTKNDHILMHPFMCARIIHHLVVVGHILHNFTSAQNLNTYKNILHDFVHKLWLFCLVLSKNILLLLPVWVGCWSWIYRPHWIYS